jgi:hypothetical protein
MLLSKAPKLQYSEIEAAAELGVSVDRLRSLVKDHIVKDDDTANVAMATFQASDLVVLKILAGMNTAQPLHSTASAS